MSTKILPAQYEEAYRIGLDHYDGKLGIQEASRLLLPTGMNENSAKDHVYNVRHLLRGECYKRALSEAATQDYLTWIRRDRGDAALSHALQALQEHISYRKRKQPTNNFKALNRVLEMHRELMLASKEGALVLEWRDSESAGVMDWFPLSWFSEEGVTKKLGHLIGENWRPEGKAFCDVTVKRDTAELDYRPYGMLNDVSEVLPGVVRLTFTDFERLAIADVAWKPANKTVFAKPAFRLPTVLMPSVLESYRRPTESAEKSLRCVRERPGQAAFRRKLILLYGNRCCISGCTVAGVLEGAHIDPYRNSASDHVQNGLLLRADLHILFDRHLVAIDPDTMKIHFAERVRAAPDYDSWHGVPLKLPVDPIHHPNKGALRRHWERAKELIEPKAKAS